MSGWRIDEGRSNHGTTFFGPAWPHDGSEGEVLYANASPHYGWRFLVARAGSTRLETTTLRQVYRRLPPDLYPAVTEAQEKMERIATDQARAWLERRTRFVFERRHADSFRFR